MMANGRAAEIGLDASRLTESLRRLWRFNRPRQWPAGFRRVWPGLLLSAIATVLPRDETSDRELIFTIAGVTLLSTLAMILYPLIASTSGLDAHQAGVFIGGTIHDVAQVVGAGYSISPEAGDFAVFTKLLRVAILLPVVVAISLLLRHRFGRAEPRGGDPLLPPIPARVRGAGRPRQRRAHPAVRRGGAR